MCTALTITDTNGICYHGRGAEFSTPLPLSVDYVPAGTKFSSLTPKGEVGMSFTTQYPILGMPATGVAGQNETTFFLEGFNNQGLSLSINGLLDSESPPVGNDNSKILTLADLPVWILGNCKNVAQVKQALQSGMANVWLPPITWMANMPCPGHLALFDKDGTGIVIEWTNGVQNIYDNPVGVMTNRPDFPWHLTNLAVNYTNTNVDVNTGQLGQLKLSTPDGGIALSALPSSQTAVGRFVRAAFYVNYVRKAKTPDEAIVTLGHIMNNFDRPYDLSIDPPGHPGDGPVYDIDTSEVSLILTMSDKGRNRFYVRTIDMMNWVMFDMNKLSGITQRVSIPISALKDGDTDVTALLM